MKDFLRKPTLYIIIIIILLILLFLKSCGNGNSIVGNNPNTNGKNKPGINATNKIFNTSKTQTDPVKKLCKENLYAIGRSGAGTFLAVGDGGITLTTFNGGLNWKPGNKIVKGDLYGAAVLNPDTMVAVGKNGTIIRTTNHGVSWDSISGGTNKNLRSVSFPDRVNGIAVGDSGLILKTNNAGLTWSNISLPSTANINSVCFINATTGWFAGNGGQVRKTTNFGTTWLPETTTTTKNLNSISFNNDYRGTAIGETGTILSTTNGGSNWTSAAHLPIKNLKGVHRVSNVLAYIAGDGIVIREDKGVLTNLDTDSLHKFNAVDPGQYITDIAVGNLGISMAMTTAACDSCGINGNNDLMFIPPAENETNWTVRLRVYPGYFYRQYMRFISPGFILDHAIGGWTQYDGAVNQEYLADADANGSNGNYRTTTINNVNLTSIDAITLDMKTNTSGYLYFTLSPASYNTNSTGTFEFYFGECTYGSQTASTSDIPCGLANQDDILFCHKVTYSLAAP